MAVVIRMKRTGRRNRPCYRISVADRQFPRDGRTLENLGVYDPASPIPELRLKVDIERARVWLDRGAIPSDTVRSILKREGAYVGRPVPEKRTRPGRNKKTVKKANRAERKARFAEAKQGRRTERVAAKKAAAAAGATEEES